MWAAAERHAPVVKLLLERGADWKVRSFDRETKPPRLSAASSISPIPRGGFTALMFAAREGDLESARIMLDAGVDINYGDVDNATPLVAAIMNKQYTLAKFLIDRGADVNIVDAGGRTALYAIDRHPQRGLDGDAEPHDRRPAADVRGRQGDRRSRREAGRPAHASAARSAAAWISATPRSAPARRR